MSGTAGTRGGKVCSERCHSKRQRQIETPEHKRKNRERNQRRHAKKKLANLAVKRVIQRITGQTETGTPLYVTLDRRMPHQLVKRRRALAQCAECGDLIIGARRWIYCSLKCSEAGEKKLKAMRTRRHYREYKEAYFVNKLIAGDAID